MPTAQNNSYFKVAYFQVAGPVQSSNTTNSLFRTRQQLLILLALNLGSYCKPLSSTPTNAALQKGRSQGAGLDSGPHWSSVTGTVP